MIWNSISLQFIRPCYVDKLYLDKNKFQTSFHSQCCHFPEDLYQSYIIKVFIKCLQGARLLCIYSNDNYNLDSKNNSVIQGIYGVLCGGEVQSSMDQVPRSLIRTLGWGWGWG